MRRFSAFLRGEVENTSHIVLPLRKYPHFAYHHHISAKTLKKIQSGNLVISSTQIK